MTRKLNRLVFAFLFLTALNAFAARVERKLDSWKPTHYNVQLTFNDGLTEITSARTDIIVVALKDSLSQIDLDFGDMPIDSVMVEGRSAAYERNRGRLNITLAEPVRKGTTFVVAVSYHGKPSDALEFRRDKSDTPSVVGDNWPDRVHHWIPCFDHPSAKATVTFSITAPSRQVVVANGMLVSMNDAAGTNTRWTFIESVPIPPYCMIVAVGNFARLKPATNETVPLEYYVPMIDRDFAVQGFSTASPSLKFFSETVAPYPYEKLALIVGATRFGGMENSSAIVFAANLFNPRPSEAISPVFKLREGLVDIVAHEIAHQWFGDSVTPSTWADLWLSEGFADYFAGLFIERYEGEQTFREYMNDLAKAYFGYENNNKKPIYDTETKDLLKLLNANNYQKGAWVLHMLRSELGDEKFFHGIRNYYETHKNANASSEDLRAALEKASGKNLKEFFASWIYGAGHPRYELSWTWNAKKKKVRLVLSQTQQEAAFPNAVPIQFRFSNGTRLVVLKPTSKQIVEELSLAQAPGQVAIDPDGTILKEAEVRSENRGQK
jgi:aminopeptidase N